MIKDHKAFIRVKRKASVRRAPRQGDFSEEILGRGAALSRKQASRCMECGTPFCHWGCPAGSPVPEWNAALSAGRIKTALGLIESANPFPEITGRLCPAPCEFSCVLGLSCEAVTIRDNEFEIIEEAFRRGLAQPAPPAWRKPSRAAVIGSGPAGLSAAFFLNRMGITVEVYEKDDKIGGLLRYGIPGFKLDKRILDRRIGLLEREGIIFKPKLCAGRDVEEGFFTREFDAVCVAAGAGIPRDIEIPGRDLQGICFALDYLAGAGVKAPGTASASGVLMDAKGKKVVVIGGGDTGSDCAGTAARQGAECIAQIDAMPPPPAGKSAESTWPASVRTPDGRGNRLLRRLWETVPVEFTGRNGRVVRVECKRAEWKSGAARPIPGTGFVMDADLVVIAAGFTGSVKRGAPGLFGADVDAGCVYRTDSFFMTTKEKIFAAGDARRGQSLVIHAITEGRECARRIGDFLLRKTV